jgi:hypothetical protein
LLHGTGNVLALEPAGIKQDVGSARKKLQPFQQATLGAEWNVIIDG